MIILFTQKSQSLYKPRDTEHEPRISHPRTYTKLYIGLFYYVVVKCCITHRESLHVDVGVSKLSPRCSLFCPFGHTRQTLYLCPAAR